MVMMINMNNNNDKNNIDNNGDNIDYDSNNKKLTSIHFSNYCNTTHF